MMKRRMRWYAGRGRHFYNWYGRWFGRMEDGTEIEVTPAVYAEQFAVYLDLLGFPRKSWYGIMQRAEAEWRAVYSSSRRCITWSEIMQRAEAEWQEYCHLMDSFAENLQQWLDYRGSGVFIDTPVAVLELKSKRT